MSTARSCPRRYPASSTELSVRSVALPQCTTSPTSLGKGYPSSTHPSPSWASATISPPWTPAMASSSAASSLALPIGDGNVPFHYVVCNPATKEWMMLPKANWASDSSYPNDTPIACLGFDLAISSHFHVLEYMEGPDECITA